ncbi:hypothetical protein Egran_03005 [Elaphomyces granulatus]|uniref:tRNA-splicing endonuclease subunit Sen34 n=1 Tax=Elaphomyces granulatus TaxID=519963 RepID=A0A232LYN5_9EURO|nr:hypothetical protein Egran_03005 [Elaphomyces granulatus]
MATIPTLPIPISYITDRYLLFSIDAVMYLRREHHICGVPIGTLPQIPQQNVFLGLPLELTPEEARLLVEKGIAFIIDEASSHNSGLKTLGKEDKSGYLLELEQEGQRAARLQAERKEIQREEALKQISHKINAESEVIQARDPAGDLNALEDSEDPGLFTSYHQSGNQPASSRASVVSGAPMSITPATSYPPLQTLSSCEFSMPLPNVPTSYPLFAHLHSKGYFLAPGLRFGCQYLAYPGDPLRFHSHFLVVSAEWDEEIDLLDLIVCGRLGTGVKKGFLLGGVEKKSHVSEDQDSQSIRTFSLEWAGM